jgi:LacI family transcriptional regulator, galactose operon repressor
MDKRPTIKDVAKKAGLSLSTVSLVINRTGYVSEETRSRVIRVIDELRYHPTRAARGLASRTSGNIGFILTDNHFSQAEPFYTRIFLGTEFEARKHNYYILLTTVGKGFRPGSSIPRFLLERNVDGVIVAGRVNEKLIDYIEKLRVPVVLVDFEFRRRRMSAVLADNRQGARLAVQHLIQSGHRKIGFIGGDIEHPSIAERFAEYERTLVDHGILPDRRFIITDEDDNRIPNGLSAAARMFGPHSVTPTALFAANDAMAIGCLQYLKQNGIRVPSDVALVGFDDIEMTSHVEPRLTTVHIPKEEMGAIAVRSIAERVKSKTQSVATTYVPVELIIRESSGRVTRPVDAGPLTAVPE